MPNRRLWCLFLCCLATAAGPVLGDTSTWTQTAASTTYNWNVAGNWTDGIPDGAGDVANVNIDIAGTQFIRLRKDITLGELNIGDGGGTLFNINLQNVTAESFKLIFNNGAAPAQLRTTGVGTSTNTINAPVVLDSDLAVTMGGPDVLTFGSSGSITTNNHNLTFSGGAAAVNGVNFNGDILGGGVITNNGSMAIIFSGAKSFTGTLVANSGTGGSNTGSFTLTNGSVADAAELIINGYLTGGTTQNGGMVNVGSGSRVGSNPGQRLTKNTITLNGGTLRNIGQPATVGSASPWQQGLEAVIDEVTVLKFNTGYSHLILSSAGDTAGTVLDVAALQRGAGGTGYIASNTLGTATGARLLIDNPEAHLKGAGASSGTETSVIPWLGAANTNAFASAPDGFVTHTATGLRALVTAEYATSITAGSTHNVTVTNLTISGPTTVNSMRFTGSGSSNITDNQSSGAGQVLTVSSGGVFFSASGTIGETGSSRAGTLNFGSAEGVVWVNGSNTATIGAVINGSGGLTKAGTGTLVLSGANNHGGTTIVSGGTLQVGIGSAGRSGSGPLLLNAQGTVLAGTGLIQGAATVTAGQVRPGDDSGAAIGTLNFGGGLTFDPAAAPSGGVTTVAEMKILNAGSADKIVIEGDLNLDTHSRFVVTLDAGYTPVEGDSWDLLDWTGVLNLNGFDAGAPRDGSADGTSNLDLPSLDPALRWNITNFSGSGALTLTIAAIPEPSRALLLLAGMLTLLMRRRRD